MLVLLWMTVALATGENLVIKLNFISITTFLGRSLESISKQLSARYMFL